MSRNLGRSYCCENFVRLEDMRGRPIEFRRYTKYSPHIGCRWDCPTCGTVYFAWWRDSIDANGVSFVIDLSYYESFNDEHDLDYAKMAKFLGLPEDTAPGEICKQWWLRCPGEEGLFKGPEHARHVCTDNAEDAQDISWGSYREDYPLKENK